MFDIFFMIMMGLGLVKVSHVTWEWFKVLFAAEQTVDVDAQQGHRIIDVTPYACNSVAKTGVTYNGVAKRLPAP